MSNIQLSISILNLRTDIENAKASDQIWINLNPDFQRDYEEWNNRLQTRFIETILIGRAMNPIWTIFNPDNDSEEVLDGMHRLHTALDYFNNKFKLKSKYLSSYGEKYNNKYFKDLDANDKNKIRNYNFTINQLDSTYRTNITKRRDMYEILNKSSKTLNEYEYNKVLYNPFYEIISYYKEDFNNLFFNKKDKRGDVESDIINMLVLSEKLKNSWISINNLRSKWYEENLGITEEDVNKYLKNNKSFIINKLKFIKKVLQYLKDKNFIKNSDKKYFKKYFLPYNFIICRIIYKLENISVFHRHINSLMKIFEKEILTIDLQEKLECTSRNATFQKKLLNLIDELLDNEYNKKDKKNNRSFSENDYKKKLKEQFNKCNICNKEKKKDERYEADHIKPWSKKGLTEYDNLQVLCKTCHMEKSR